MQPIFYQTCDSSKAESVVLKIIFGVLYGTKAFKIKNTKYDVSCKIMPKVVLMGNGSQLPAL